MHSSIVPLTVSHGGSSDSFEDMNIESCRSAYALLIPLESEWRSGSARHSTLFSCWKWCSTARLRMSECGTNQVSSLTVLVALCAAVQVTHPHFSRFCFALNAPPHP